MRRRPKIPAKPRAQQVAFLSKSTSKVTNETFAGHDKVALAQNARSVICRVHPSRQIANQSRSPLGVQISTSVANLNRIKRDPRNLPQRQELSEGNGPMNVNPIARCSGPGDGDVQASVFPL